MPVEINPTTLLRLKQLCESKKVLKFVDLLDIAQDFIEECDEIRDDPDAAKSLFFTALVDICDGEDDKFGTDDDVLNIDDKLDNIRKVSDAVVRFAIQLKQHDRAWEKIRRFHKKRAENSV
jgi:hypothetical protein